MEGNRKKTIAMSLVAFFLVLTGLSFAWAEQYDVMKGINSVNVIFDMRDGNPQTAVIHLNLIHDAYKELFAMNKDPIFRVVFMGSAVRLISSDHRGFNAEEQKSLKEIADTISKMSRDGIFFEACLASVNYFGVDPASILLGIEQVSNGWISEIAYQARGYSLVPVY